MKQITALLHANRLSDIVHALEAAGERRVSVVHAQGLLQASSSREQDYSVELGERVTQEIRLDVFCEDARVDDLVTLIQLHARTGLKRSGWVFVTRLEAAHPIDHPIDGSS